MTFTGVGALQEWLADQPENTAANPYRIKVTEIDLASNTAVNLKGLYAALSRYVALDLSDCTGEKISNNKSAGKAKITEIILPLNLTTVENNAFEGCTELTTIDMPGVTTIEHLAFYGCKKLETVHMEKVEAITNTTAKGNGAFDQCKALTSVSLPNATEIGKLTFNGCDLLSTVNLPKVATIGEKAFAGCKKLASLTLGATIPELGTTVFAAGNPDFIYVPASALSAYKTTTKANWTDLKAKVQALLAG
ncbi:hypothetical protein AGMMS49944_03450 [Spirochaetia bacterium]|nr:hypothetical protein AGMMS49944_03450 [Spirochaetia bacterium]